MKKQFEITVNGKTLPCGLPTQRRGVLDVADGVCRFPQPRRAQRLDSVAGRAGAGGGGRRRERRKKKPLTIHELLGIGLGPVGLSLADFRQLTPDEFEAVCKAWSDTREADERGAWERTRLAAAICIQPHVSRRISPRKLVPLPWDNDRPQQTIPTQTESAPPLSAEERLKRFEELAKQL